MPISDNNKRIAKNTLILYLRMCLSMLISIYTSRIIFNSLGVDNFGVLNVAGGIIAFFTFINSSMSLATQRFITYEIGLGKKGNANHVFNTCVLCHFFIGIIVLFFAETIGLWFINHYLNIPAVKMVAANWIYQFSMLSTILGITQVPYGASIIAVEKMGIYAYMSIIDIVLKLVIVLLLKWISGDKLIVYGALLLSVAIINLYINNWYCRKKISFCHFKIEWDKKLFKQMTSFSGWTLGGQMMNVSVTQGRSVLVNIFYSVRVNAAIGIANQLCNIVNSFVGNFQMAFNPQLTKSFAQENFEASRLMLYRASKFSYFLLLFLAIPIYSETSTLLTLWLGDYPEYTVEFCRAILVLMLVGAISNPIVIIVFATGNIKKYQVGIFALCLTNLITMFLLLYFHVSPVATIWFHVFIDSMLIIWRLRFASAAIQMPIKDYLEKVIVRSIGVTLIALLPIMAFRYYVVIAHPFLKLLFVTIISTSSISVFLYFLGLNKAEQYFVADMVKRKLLKTRV